jgi:hypothetical protein
MGKIASLVAAASPRLDPVSRRREETTIAHEVNLAPSYHEKPNSDNPCRLNRSMQHHLL